MAIEDYKGNSLFSQIVFDAIEKEVDYIVKNKEVDKAYSALSHIKNEISSIPSARESDFFEKYRRITSKLKCLCLPLIEEGEVVSLLKNSLDLLDTESENFLFQGLVATLAGQDDKEKERVKKSFIESVDKNSVFGPKVIDFLQKTGHLPDSDDVSNDNVKESTGSSSAAGQNTSNSTERIASQIFSRSGTNQAEDVFVRRAKALLDSRLRDVRSKTDLAEYFSRPFQVGGLGLVGEALMFAQKISEDEYSRIHKITPNFDYAFSAQNIPEKSQPIEIDKNTKDQEKQEQNAITEDFSGGSKSVVSAPDGVKNQDLNLEKQNQKEKTVAQAEIDKLISSDVAAGSYSIENILKSKPAQNVKTDANKPEVKQNNGNKKEQDFESLAVPVRNNSFPSVSQNKEQEDSKSEEQAPKQFFAQRQTQAPEGKVRLEDVKFSNQNTGSPQRPGIKSFGLADEFSTLTIDDFRSMGDVAQASAKIISKFSVLEKNSLAQKISGIRNFHQSPLYKQYLAIGEGSLFSGKKLSDALMDSEINKSKMTEEEFFAVSDLNLKLK